MRAAGAALCAAVLAAWGCAGEGRERAASPPQAAPERTVEKKARASTKARRLSIRWRRSQSRGLPYAGRLVAGVRLPAEGEHFFTWDPVLRRSPNRPWRHFGSDRLVRTVLRVLSEYARANPSAPRVGIGDLSRPNGGDFGARFGGLGHASHQNGLDVDVYYPRRDRRERAPRTAAQVDRRLAQDLVDRFVHAGATKVFVGPRVRLSGPRRIVQILAHHDNHLHVRLGRAPGRRAVRTALLGRSEGGRLIRAFRFGPPAKARKLLVVGCIHGNECAGVAIARRLRSARPPAAAELWVVPNLNPDGYARRTRQNGRGVDLNRNFPGSWRPIGRPGHPEYSGPHPASERETRIAQALILRLRPRITVWFHQPQAVVRAWGGGIPAARRYARLAGMGFRALTSPPGAATNWQNRRLPGTSAFVVELPAGPISRRAADRHTAAILELAK